MPTYDLLLVKIIAITFCGNRKTVLTFKVTNLLKIISIIDKTYNLLNIVELIF